MIFVDRSAVAPPEVLVTKGLAELGRAREFYLIEEKDRRQSRFEFTAYRDPEVRQALEQLFHGKCAFCESRAVEGSVEGSGLDVMHFRPTGGVVRPDGTFLPDHYWWLAVEWENLYLQCLRCKRRMSRGSTGLSGSPIVGKGERFPLQDESTRAPLFAGPEELANEEILLLDPCRDDPSEHLVFTELGRVVGSTIRGQTTIEMLGLNRSSLVRARERAAFFARSRVMLAASPGREDFGPEKLRAELDRLMGATSEYAGCIRQVLASVVSKIMEIVGELPEELVLVPASERRRAQASHRRFSVEQESFSLADERGKELYRSVRREVERLSVKNVKAIQSVDLDLRRSSSSTATWTMLLGENGTGKSTILQAVALALIGQEYSERLDLDPEDFIRRAPNVKSGSVEVWLSGSTQSRKVILRRDGFEFVRSEDPQILVLGYGGSRLLPRSGAPAALRAEWARVESLFRPTTALADADAWLIEAEDHEFGYTAGAIRDLLGLLRNREWLERSEDRVVTRERGRVLPLNALSTGFQSIFATVIDILELTFELWPTPESAEGVVLLDEIDTHLHPTWKMRIVRGLRRMMPGMQFIATTHEPLCLRGLEDNEVVLMQRDAKDRAYAVSDLPSPRDLRVDQLLTSKHFGLNSTLDPDLDERFNEYYELLSYSDTELNEEQRERRDGLGLALQGHGVLGYTRRDQLVYEAIDQFLAEERRLERERRGQRVDGVEAKARRDQTLRRVANLWQFARLAESLEGPLGERGVATNS